MKLVTVLLLLHSAGLPLLVGCIFSLRVLSILRSPHVSTKPSTVFLGHLAVTDSLVVLHWILQLGVTLAQWKEEASCEIKMGPMTEMESVWWREAVKLLCQQLLDAHHLASLLLLGLLGLEAMLVSRWPQQSRGFRTSHRAQLSCRLVWILVLLELFFSLHSKLLQDCTPQTYLSTLQNSTSSPSLEAILSLPVFSFCLRRTLWLLNLFLHYTVLHSKPQEKKSFFH